MEEGQGVPSKENEPQKGAKVAKNNQTKFLNDGAPKDRGRNLGARVPNWNPSSVRRISSPCELLNQGLSRRKGRVRSKCCGASLATTR